MPDQSKPAMYRNFIDHLVEMCHKGQGQITATRARNAVWHEYATPDNYPEQHEINLFLKFCIFLDY